MYCGYNILFKKKKKKHCLFLLSLYHGTTQQSFSKIVSHCVFFIKHAFLLIYKVNKCCVWQIHILFFMAACECVDQYFWHCVCLRRGLEVERETVMCVLIVLSDSTHRTVENTQIAWVYNAATITRPVLYFTRALVHGLWLWCVCV